MCVHGPRCSASSWRITYTAGVWVPGESEPNFKEVRFTLPWRTMKSVMDSRGACTSLEMGGAFSKETVSMATL